MSTDNIQERVDLISVLVDMLHAKADVRDLVTEIALRWPDANKHSVMNDGCIGDSAGLDTLLAEPHVVVYEHYGDSEGWGHHSGSMIVVLADGRIVHASCGGCSCEGNGGWSFEDDVGDAWRMVPEQKRA